MNIGKKIRAWRDERGLTQNELASRANISRSYLAGVETGKYNPSIDTLNSIAAALNVSTSFLMEEVDLKGGIIASIYNDYPDGDLDPVTMELLSMVNNATDDERQVMLEMLRLLKAQRGKR